MLPVNSDCTSDELILRSVVLTRPVQTKSCTISFPIPIKKKQVSGASVVSTPVVTFEMEEGFVIEIRKSCSLLLGLRF